MKKQTLVIKHSFISFVIIFISINYIFAQSSLPYLGQTLPGMTPRRFAPANLLANGVWWWRTSPIFSPDGKEMLFAKYHSNLEVGNHKLYRMKDVGGTWTMPEPPTFVSDSDDYSPAYSKDGDTIYFSSTRDGSHRIYITTRLVDDWSEPQMLNFPYQSGDGEFSWDLSIAHNGTIYYSVWENNQTEIYKSVPVNGQYLTNEKLPDAINSSSHDNSAYIAPDESYIIFASDRPGGYGYHDLYISFTDVDGNWTQAQNMGSPINANHEDASPRVSPDGNYLFFTSRRSGDYGYNPYWVDADVIDQFNPFVGISNNCNNHYTFTVFPNPFDDKISIGGIENQVVNITIYNALGKAVWRQSQIEYNTNINASFIPNGFYIVEISSSKGWEQHKLIKK